MSQNLRVATWIPIEDPAALGQVIISEGLPSANEVIDTKFSAGGGAPSNAAPLMNGVAAPGVSALVSRDDHVHPTDTSRAKVATISTSAPSGGVDGDVWYQI